MSAFSERFQTIYAELRDDLVRDGLQDREIADGMQHLQKVLVPSILYDSIPIQNNITFDRS